MKFSIITITRNSAETLKETIESVQMQSFKDYEHIFVDGHSTDGTLELIEAYKQKYPGMVKLFQAEPKGISAAMNEGIRRAIGDYILHLHADDALYDSEVLADVAKFLGTKKVDWIYGKIMVRDNKGNDTGTFPNKKIFHANSNNRFKSWLLQIFNYIPHQAVFIKRNCFERFGFFDETLTSAMDPDLWLRIRTKTTWEYIDRCISSFRISTNSQTGSKETREQNRKNLRIIQRRHLKSMTYILARLVTRLVHIKQFFN